MSLRHRLRRLEQQAARVTAGPAWQSPEYQEQYDGWLAGEGPRPPEPPWTEPAVWASQMRVSRGIGMWFRGELDSFSRASTQDAEK